MNYHNTKLKNVDVLLSMLNSQYQDERQVTTISEIPLAFFLHRNTENYILSKDKLKLDLRNITTSAFYTMRKINPSYFQSSKKSHIHSPQFISQLVSELTRYHIKVVDVNNIGLLYLDLLFNSYFNIYANTSNQYALGKEIDIKGQIRYLQLFKQIKSISEYEKHVARALQQDILDYCIKDIIFSKPFILYQGNYQGNFSIEFPLKIQTITHSIDISEKEQEQEKKKEEQLYQLLVQNNNGLFSLRLQNLDFYANFKDIYSGYMMNGSILELLDPRKKYSTFEHTFLDKPALIGKEKDSQQEHAIEMSILLNAIKQLDAGNNKLILKKNYMSLYNTICSIIEHFNKYNASSNERHIKKVTFVKENHNFSLILD